ncbi:sulfur transferase domain-containing protein, partial [Paraburkholderia sp. BR14262]|uniref:beta-lactamase hydrolase domain-containing protein n=1 Tax=Paraburkholderia sp. BR14262 TaxID=3236999 RepID=UPI0034CFF79A
MQITQHDARFGSADQITPDDLAAIQAARYRSIICNRPDGEGGDSRPTSQALRAAASQLGLQFAYLPVTPGQITAEDAARFAQLLIDLPGPALAYCRSGNRATSLYRLAQQGAPTQAAQTATAARAATAPCAGECET